MNLRKVATLMVLVFSSFAATNVAPTKAELEAMYDRAFRQFNETNYDQALKELDAIDARQPDLAESQNLRGVILMRQTKYDQAEVALQKALATDPKFWNARFNLAEIPFLRKDWAEARKRFDALLQGNAAELQGEATQLIQYKILLTYLLQGNDNMVDSILSKFELSPETPAASYSNVAIAFQHKNEKEAKEILATAEKSFSPQLNKLFAESLYEVGWMQKAPGQTRAAIELTSAEDQAAKTKMLAAEKYEQAERAFQQRDFTTARQLVEESDAADPNQATTVNLRGEILLAQKDFDGAESAFRQAVKLDPKMTEAQYNLAQVPFRKKEYGKARDAFEALYTATAGAGGDKNQTAQIIKFNIYLTLLLEGKDARAQKMMEQFKFTGDTPALYYAQAAWEFKHNNAPKANDWIVSARKIYSPALNFVFANGFYDLGWLQSQAPATTTASTEVAKTEPEAATTAESSSNAPPPVAENNSTVTADGILTQKSVAIAPEMDLGAKLDTEPIKSDQQSVAPKEANPSDSTQRAESAQAPAEKPTEKSVSGVPAVAQQNAPVTAPKNKFEAASTNSKPASLVKAQQPAPARSQPAVTGQVNRLSTSRTLLFVTLLLAGLLLLAWVVISELRRRVNVSVYNPTAPATAPRFGDVEHENSGKKGAGSGRLAGGPPQISLQLKASEPSVRRAAVPFGKMNRPLGPGAVIPVGNGAGNESFAPREAAPIQEPPPSVQPEFQPTLETASAGATTDLPQVGDYSETPEVSEITSAPDWEFSPVRAEPAINQPIAPAFRETSEFSGTATPFDVPVSFEKAPVREPLEYESPTFFESVGEPRVIEPPDSLVEPAEAWSAPIEQGQPVPQQVSAFSDLFSETVEEPVSTSSDVAAKSAEILVPEVSVPEMETVAHDRPIRVPTFAATPSEMIGEPRAIPSETVAISSQTRLEETPEPQIKGIAEGPPIRVPEFSIPTHEAVGEPISVPSEIAAESTQMASAEISKSEIEVVAEDQAIPYQIPSFSSDSPMAEITQPEPDAKPPHFPSGTIAAVGGIRHSVESPSFAPQVISTEPIAQQPTIPATMPETIQTPTIRTAPMPGGMPQPQSASGMHTAVQLTFSFEIASMQLTPSFKMGALQLKPTSKIVTMRLAPSQQPQPAMNLQVTFEVASVQLAGNAIGMIRLTPSQQQRPGVISSPAFSVAGLQLLAGSESSGAVQITPSQQGQASVHVTGRFQIATVEFSPSFEIASIVLNSTSKNVSVQLPGAGPSAVEGAPVFEVSNVQLAGNGEIGMMQLVAQGAAPKAA